MVTDDDDVMLIITILLFLLLLFCEGDGVVDVVIIVMCVRGSDWRGGGWTSVYT